MNSDIFSSLNFSKGATEKSVAELYQYKLIMDVDKFIDWLMQSNKGETVIYYKGLAVSATAAGMEIQRITYASYEFGYVHLFQRKVKDLDGRHFEYIACRTGLRYTETPKPRNYYVY